MGKHEQENIWIVQKNFSKIKARLNVPIFLDHNPSLANVPISYPLETPEDLCYSVVFRGYKMRTSATNNIKVYLKWLDLNVSLVLEGFLEEARVFYLHSLRTLNFASQILQKCVRYVESYELIIFKEFHRYSVLSLSHLKRVKCK